MTREFLIRDCEGAIKDYTLAIEIARKAGLEDKAAALEKTLKHYKKRLRELKK